MQRRVDVLWMRQAPVLLRMATAPKKVVRDAEVEDQAPAARLVLKVVADLHVAAQLACAGHDPLLCVNRVCRAVRNRGPRTETIQLCALVAPE
jgi:hypothetical protein